MSTGAVRGNRSAISRIPVANTYFNKKLWSEVMTSPRRGPEVPVPRLADKDAAERRTKRRDAESRVKEERRID